MAAQAKLNQFKKHNLSNINGLRVLKWGFYVKNGRKSVKMGIRKGLNVDKIAMNLISHFGSWDYRHGQYY